MIKKVLHTVEKYGLVERGDKIVIALSGGADSVFLLYALDRIKRAYSLKLYIAHLNHQLRKKADEDAEFVQEMAKEYAIQCFIGKKDVKKHAKERKLSLEEGAREVRYNFLEEVANKVGANKIAMGHTITDEAETLIFRLMRGTGLKGLTLIPPKRDKIIRPLIEIEHNEILDFLKNKNIAYRQDYSNYKTKHTRNFIRYKIMPQINKQVSDFGEKSMRLRNIIEAEEKFLEKTTNEKFEKLCKVTDKKITLDLNGFSKEDLAIQRRIIRKIQDSFGSPRPSPRSGNYKGISFEETENILKSILNSHGATISFELSPCVRELNKDRINKPVNFPVPGKFRVGKIKLHSEICNRVHLNTATKDKVYFDFDKLAFPLFIRNRKNGDVFSGDGYNKKLKELFIDDKVQKEARDTLPLLLDQSGILWVIKHRRSAKALVDKQTRKILKIEATAEKG